jgi:hypothetical protein
MLIEGEDNSKEKSNFPSFNPEAFLEEDNEVTSNTNFYGAEQQQEEDEDNDDDDDGGGKDVIDKVIDDEVSFEDDFLTYEAKVKKEEVAEFKAEDYAALGKTLGIEINSQQDLDNAKAKFNTAEAAKVDTKAKSNHNFSPEEEADFGKLNDALSAANSSTPEQLMKWHLKRVNTNADYENNPDELDYHIDTLKETGMFDSQVNSIKDKLLSDINEQREDLISSSTQRDLTSTNATNKELETHIKSYKDGFHGIKLNPKDLLETFNSVRNGTVFTEIESSQANVAEMALLWKNKDIFYKAFENPDTSAGVKKMMEELQNSRARPAAGTQTLLNPHVFDPQAFLSSEEIKSVSSRQ